ncbi:MAG: hypothetical protein DRG83_22075, partial [Deltaproteobacteria bacterium]
VVDNNSQDESAKIVQQYNQNYFPKVEYALETRQGLSYARNLGVKLASSDIIAFIDDDAVAHPDWLASLLSMFDSIPDAWAVGGKVLPIWDGKRPKWIRDSMLRSLSIVDWGAECRPLKWPERIIGTNCSFRRRVFSEVGLFTENLGRRGTLLLGNEDTEMQERIHRLGKLVFYTPHAIVYHHVPHERMTKKYFYCRAYGTGKSHAILASRQDDVNGSLKRAFFSGLKLFQLILSFMWNIGREDTLFRTFRGIAFHFGYLTQAIALIWTPKSRSKSGMEL